ncbi:MAG: HDIG domain-containing protein [Clostridia bacterium]|nr:HDIG domain-containing protein [Clostridia bacterium]
MMPNRRAAKKSNVRSRKTLREIFGTKTAQTVLVMIVGVIVLCGLMTIAIAPKRYNLRVGDISHTTITATKDVVDEVSTARQREEAASKVEPSYVFNETVTTDVLLNLETVLKQVNTVQQYGRNILMQQFPDDPKAQQSYQFKEAELSYAQSQLTQLTLAGYQLQTLLHASDQQMMDMTSDLTAAVENTMNTTIREGYVSETIQYLQQIVGYKTDIDLLQNVVTPILRKVMQPNMLIDQTATEALRQEARDAVEPVIYKQGQNIVLARERVNVNQLEMLRSLGLLDNDDVDVMMYVSAIALVLVAIAVLVMALMMFTPNTLQRPSRMLIIMLGMCLTLGVCILAKLVNVYLMPTLLAVVMLTSLLGARVGMAACLCLTVIIGTLATGSESTFSAQTVNIIMTTLISGITAIMIVRRKPNRQQILLCGIITAVVNAALILIVGFMTNTSLHDVAADAIWSGAAAAAASILTIAFDPLIEAMFNLATPSKLMELSNPNHPLLRRLLIEASGTYHHSIIVANLAEAAAESVDANQLLARAGAYFHDIGKLKRPLYFKENQIGDNPHEHTNPYVSAAIVTAHTRDGLVLAQQYRLPQEIQNIIVEHHGDTPVMYFYHKASQQANDGGVDIADFRYDGKRPQTKESAIIMLADTVEAAVRSMSNPTPKAIEDFIHKLVQGKLDDGQLSEAPLTLLDVERICQAFTTVLKGVFHERIEYPSMSPAATARVNASLAAEEGHTESRVEAMELRKVEAAPAAKPETQTPPAAPQPAAQSQTAAQAPAAQPAKPASPAAQNAQGTAVPTAMVKASGQTAAATQSATAATQTASAAVQRAQPAKPATETAAPAVQASPAASPQTQGMQNAQPAQPAMASQPVAATKAVLTAAVQPAQPAKPAAEETAPAVPAAQPVSQPVQPVQATEEPKPVQPESASAEAVPIESEAPEQGENHED